MINGADSQPVSPFVRTQAVAFYLNHSDFTPGLFSTGFVEHIDAAAHIRAVQAASPNSKLSVCTVACMLYVYRADRVLNQPCRPGPKYILNTTS